MIIILVYFIAHALTQPHCSRQARFDFAHEHEWHFLILLPAPCLHLQDLVTLTIISGSNVRDQRKPIFPPSTIHPDSCIDGHLSWLMLLPHTHPDWYALLLMCSPSPSVEGGKSLKLFVVEDLKRFILSSSRSCCCLGLLEGQYTL